MVEGEETAVRYWQDTIKGLVDQYLLEFPNGVKRTYLYTHLPTNFCMYTMLAGLCNLCDDFGHSNFDELCSLIDEVSSMCPVLKTSSMIKDVRVYQTFLKTKFSNWHKNIHPVLNCACHMHLMPAQKTTKQCVQIFHTSVLHTALY